MRIRPCCGRYIGHCAGGTSAYGPRASHQTSLSPLSPYPQALPTTLPARSNSPAAPTSRPRPRAATGCPPRRAYQAHRTTRPRTRKRRSQTRRPQAGAVSSHRRTRTRPRRRRPVWPRGLPHRRASSTRSSTNSLISRVSRSPNSCCRLKRITRPRPRRRPPPRAYSRERFVR